MPYDPSRDLFNGKLATADAPAKRAALVTKSNTTDLSPYYAKALLVAVSGDLVFLPAGNEDGQTVTMPVAAGMMIPVMTRRVLTSSTAVVLGLFE